MEKYTALVILIVAILAVGAYIYVNVGSGGGIPENTITVTGNAEIKVMPDLAVVYLNIQAEDNDADDAKDEVAEIYEDVRVALIKLGLDNEDIQTETFNIYPNYVWSGSSRTINGYTATHRVKVIVDDFDDVGEIVDAAVDNGALISYINFELSEERQTNLKKQALEEAAQDAKEKAEALAIGSGGKLGKLVTLQSSDFGYNPWRYYDVAVQGAGESLEKATTNINPSEQNVNAYVTAVYKIK